jgi:hypothetical protein
MLVGIGLMLVGASAYALPEHQEFSRLFPAFAGIVIATCGFVAMAHGALRKHLMHLATLAAALALVYAAIWVVPDAMASRTERIQVISDADVLCLSAVYLYFAIKSFVLSKLLKKEEEK